MKLGDGLYVVQGTESSHILMIAYIASLVLLSKASERYFLRKGAGPQEGNPCPRLRDCVLTARGVMMVQTVGLLKPLSLCAA